MTNSKNRSGRGRRKKNKDNVNPTVSATTTTPISKSKPKPKLNEKPEKVEQSKLPFGELQILQQVVLDFTNGDEPFQELTGLSKLQRKEIHLFARHYGIKTRSRSTGGKRILTISRAESTQSRLRPTDVKLSVTMQFVDVLDSILRTLSRRRGPSLHHQRRNAAAQSGGLLGVPRIPPLPHCVNPTLIAERRDLPIAAKRERVFDLLEMSQVLIVNGATGSGKSTQLPQFLLEHASETEQPVRIVVSQPRRVAAISVSGRVAEERGESLGDTVGYIIRMESNCSNNTLLAFTTSGCLLRTLAMKNTEFFSNTTHLVIDEVHDRDLNTDFLLLAIKLELERNKSLKLILMSATMDLEALSTYFGNAPVLDVEGRSFNVRIYSLENILHMTGYMTPQMQRALGDNPEPNGTQLLEAYSQAHNINEQDIDNSLIVSLLEVLLLMGIKGAVIVYLPGYQDMTKLLDMLQDSLPGDLVKILLLHSQVDSQRQRDVFREFPNVQLKIVLSTNIGQTSITISDLLYVIDTGRVKMKTYDPGTGASHLGCVWVSQADAHQRTGRAGRRKDGICYRLYSNELFNSFDRFTVPEIMRHTLDEVCLLAKIAAPNMPIEEFLSQALDPPQSPAIAQACAKLKLLRVLRDEDESVTELGHIIAELPLDVQLAKCLIYGIYFQCLGSLTIISAYYSVRDPFVLPADRSARGEQRKAREQFSVDCFSDSLGILQLYHRYICAEKKSYREKERFCEKNFLCRKSMDLFTSAVHTLRLTVMRIFKFVDINAATKYDCNSNMVRLSLTAGLYPKIVFIDRSKNLRLIAENDPRVQLSRSSCLPMSFAKRLRSNMSDWLIYVDKTRTTNLFSNIEHVTLISTLMVSLQCGKVARLEPYEVQIPAPEGEALVDQSLLRLDSWLHIIMPTDLGAKILRLRSHMAFEFNDLVTSRIMVPSRCPSVDFVQQLLDLDMDISGLSANDVSYC